MQNAEVRLLADTMDKLEQLLAENGLVYTFTRSSYPVVLSISPNTGLENQMELYTTNDNDVSSRDAKLMFIFQDGDITIRTDSRLVISDALMGKIKNHAKKMHYLFLQAFFRGETEKKAAETADSQEA